MASLVPTVADIEKRGAQLWPVLDDRQIARLARFGAEEKLPAGTILWDEGQVGVPFFVILEGEVEVVHPRGVLEEPITVHTPGQFSGEVTLLTMGRALVRGRAKTDVRVLRLAPAGLQNVIQTDSELSEIFMRAFILRRVGLILGHQGDAVVLGSQHSAQTLRLQAFLTRNGHPYRYVDVEREPDVQSMLDEFHVTVTDIPVLICRGDKVLKNPSNVEVADCLGFNPTMDDAAVHDVVIVGAGPAGLAAAVYAASEGLDALVVEAMAPGGQAGSSSKIENYLGFPTGISGQALAHRALNQAEKFGARFAVARTAVSLDCTGVPYVVQIEGGQNVRARAVVIASGAEYRKLEIPDRERFEGVGVYYGATFIEAQRCGSDEVIVVGGGNSAGQAAMFLSQTARHVHVLIRGENLAASMSRYLIRRIEESSNVTLRTRTRLVAFEGNDALESVTWLDERTGERETRPIRHVFTMAGADPNTSWLQGCLRLDEKGFVLTGTDLKKSEGGPGAPRAPLQFETSLRNVFAVGDARAGSVKRVAASVGEGSACVQLIHKALAG
ncbi:MAG TPA: FAD-dependent oxidoreductase [Polyangiaceae bacterium]|jgi:thioredoxin reductase (NADPH)|nr:FAD-dependent oxidoreductase [Polyangiaceae bacterium]